MDVEVIILIVLIGGAYMFYNIKSSSPVPGIGEYSGSALVGPSLKVDSEAFHTLPFYETSSTGSTGTADFSNKPLENPVLPTFINNIQPIGISPYSRVKRLF